MPRNSSGSLCRVKGFTLVEALIALLVLSIGLLGVAGMQLKALQGAHAGYQRAIASLAAQDAQERLWAELSGSFPECPTPTDVNGGDWKTSWSSILPSLGELTYQDAAGDCAFTVDVTWNESRFGQSVESFSYTFRLPGAE